MIPGDIRDIRGYQGIPWNKGEYQGIPVDTKGYWVIPGDTGVYQGICRDIRGYQLCPSEKNYLCQGSLRI